MRICLKMTALEAKEFFESESPEDFKKMLIAFASDFKGAIQKQQIVLDTPAPPKAIKIIYEDPLPEDGP